MLAVKTTIKRPGNVDDYFMKVPKPNIHICPTGRPHNLHTYNIYMVVLARQGAPLICLTNRPADSSLTLKCCHRTQQAHKLTLQSYSTPVNSTLVRNVRSIQVLPLLLLPPLISKAGFCTSAICLRITQFPPPPCQRPGRDHCWLSPGPW